MSFKRILAIFLVYVITCCAWVILFGVTQSRTHEQNSSLREDVGALWGESQRQRAPSLSFRQVRPALSTDGESRIISPSEAELLELQFPRKPESESDTKDAIPSKDSTSKEKKQKDNEEPLFAFFDEKTAVSLDRSRIDVTLKSDPRRKGLVWFALYDVGFKAEYLYEHQAETAGYLDIELSLPSNSAIYDELTFKVNGEDKKAALDLNTGRFHISLPVKPGTSISFETGYRTRGSDEWSYRPGDRVQQLEDFRLSLNTDFKSIDFPEGTQSPSSKSRSDRGWDLNWDLKSTVTGQGMGVLLPQKLQPGELSSALILSAPVSLLFFFVVLFIVATLQKLDLHPMNYLFISAAFFAFHLLFSYSADHLSVVWAFSLSSMASLALVVSYLRLVVSPRFAFVEAGLAQLIYLVGFSVAHFWEGFTGLTVTVLAVLTLFVVMQATGRLNWTEIFQSKGSKKT